MLIATDHPGALFGACSDSWHVLDAALALGASSFTRIPEMLNIGLPLPHLAMGATLAPGLGALAATLVYALLRGGGQRAAVLVVLVPLSAWLAYISFGLQHPAEAAGLVALGCLGVAAVPATGSIASSDQALGATGWAVGLSRAGALLLLALVLDGAPAGWGLFLDRPPWSPGVAARLLDLSPRTFTMEIAGFDWMRHPSIYESVGTDRISPSLRPPFGHGSLGASIGDSAGYGPWGRAVAVLPAFVVGSLVTAIRLFRRSKLSANSR